MIYWLCAISVFVKGVDNGERISVYTTNGFEVDNGVAPNRCATINTNLQKRNIAIVKKDEDNLNVLILFSVFLLFSHIEGTLFIFDVG